MSLVSTPLHPAAHSRSPDLSRCFGRGTCQGDALARYGPTLTPRTSLRYQDIFITRILEHPLARVQQRELLKGACAGRLHIDSGRLLARHRIFSRRHMWSHYPFRTLGPKVTFSNTSVRTAGEAVHGPRDDQTAVGLPAKFLTASAGSHVPHPSNSSER
jgi:hypothetical protein